MPANTEATSAPSQVEPEDAAESEGDEAERKDANALMGMGVGVGVFGAASALLIGATCPLCVVVAPALVGAGVYKRIRSKRRNKDDDS